MTAADGSRFGAVFSGVCEFICLFPLDILKSDAARIAKLDINESWKSYFVSGVKVMRHQKRCRRAFSRSCECWLLVYAVVVSQ